MLNFSLDSDNHLGAMLLKKGISNYYDATEYIHSLPYNRNTNKKDLACVIKDGHGCSSTKHAFLAALAQEHGVREIHLMLGMYRMDPTNTPQVAHILRQYDFNYMPDAHNYLKYKGQIFDYTLPDGEIHFKNDLIMEIEIMPDQVGKFKELFHKQLLEGWILNEKPHLSLTEIWAIRERCVLAFIQV